MPTPSPTPTDDELRIAAEIMMVDIEDVLDIVSSNSTQGFSDVNWAATLNDIDSWDSIKGESGDIKRVGSIEFFEGKNISTRLDFRNMIRSRYGLDVLFYEGQGDAVPLTSTLRWFC